MDPIPLHPEKTCGEESHSASAALRGEMEAALRENTYLSQLSPCTSEECQRALPSHCISERGESFRFTKTHMVLLVNHMLGSLFYSPIARDGSLANGEIKWWKTIGDVEELSIGIHPLMTINFAYSKMLLTLRSARFSEEFLVLWLKTKGDCQRLHPAHTEWRPYDGLELYIQ